jgi:hypothetical protein
MRGERTIPDLRPRERGSGGGGGENEHYPQRKLQRSQKKGAAPSGRSSNSSGKVTPDKAVGLLRAFPSCGWICINAAQLLSRKIASRKIDEGYRVKIDS